MSKEKRLLVTQVASSIGRQKNQRQTLSGLGLRGIGSSSSLKDTSSVRGMLNAVCHLVKFKEI